MNVPAAGITALPHGEVITFYSYKGGTGRSMLLANIAWQLAAAGQRVLIVDWDLEAPGVHRYFRPFLGDDPELQKQEGVIQWMLDYWDAKLDEPNADAATLVRNYADPRHYVRRLETGNLLPGGIDLLCAGRQDSAYATAVADFDWTRLFGKLDGTRFIDAAKDILVGDGGYDYVLVDSRTGVSDTSGFCTVLLADTLVVCFTYNNQSVIGASQIARDIKRQAEGRRLDAVTAGQARRFRLFAVPSRIDEMDPERLDRRQKHAWACFEDLLTDVAQDQQSSYWVSVQIRNSGLFAYEELLAACVNRPNDPQSVLGAVTQLTRRLTEDAFYSLPSLADAQRAELRERFSELSNTTGPPSGADAWHRFIQQMPQQGARDGLLQACFPLLVQLFTVSSSDLTEPQRDGIVRAMLLESELTADERRMAETLTTLGVAQRRITNDRQRGLLIADESILVNWSALDERLKQQLAFLETREKVHRARIAWESGGRTLSSLQALQGEFALLELSDEQRAWLGRPNLQLIQAAHDLRTIGATQRELKDRIEFLEEQRQRRESELSKQANELRRESLRAVRNVMRFRGAVLAGFVGVAALVVTSLYVMRVREQLGQTQASLDAVSQTAAATSARLDDALRVRAQEAALRYYGEGTRQFVQAGKTTNANYDTNIDGAVDSFTRAINADPSLAEAFRGRALARGNMRKRDIPNELLDWATYYDLVPSLNGRSQLILRAAAEPAPDEALLDAQLRKLMEDARQPRPDAPPQRVAASLEARFNTFPPTVQPHLRTAIDALKSARYSASAGSSSTKGAEPRTGKPTVVSTQVAEAQPSLAGPMGSTRLAEELPATARSAPQKNSRDTEALQNPLASPDLPVLRPQQKVPLPQNAFNEDSRARNYR